MRHFNNILYVGHGTSDETEGLKQALSLARNNQAPLKVLIVCPDFPTDMPDYKMKYEESLLEQANASIHSTKKAIKIAEEDVELSVELESDKNPSIRIIQHVLRNSHDLVIKEAEPLEDGGFKAIDMSLLRKCPCPVWLCRAIKQTRQQIHVAVAIDPASKEPAVQALSKRMLELSSSLADSCSGELSIISCWDYEFENYLRGSMWIKMYDQQITEIVIQAQNNHKAVLEALIKESRISGIYHIHHLRGRAEELIPSFTENKKVDILVMGTVARTGIKGLLIGNTAENIVQKLSCSLIALKPSGFISPVKAY